VCDWILVGRWSVVWCLSFFFFFWCLNKATMNDGCQRELTCAPLWCFVRKFKILNRVGYLFN
jgi:hypothetical protein